MFGNVDLIVLFSKRMWLSPSPTLSVDVGFVATKPFMYVEVSSAIRVYPQKLFIALNAFDLLRATHGPKAEHTHKNSCKKGAIHRWDGEPNT